MSRKANGAALTVVDIEPGRERDAADAVIAELAAHAGDIFRRGNVLCHVVRDDAPLAGTVRGLSAPRIAPLPMPLLRERIDAVVRLRKLREGEWIDCHPPDWLVRAIDARGEWTGIRPLEGVVQSPVLRPDGTVLDRPGYDVATGLLYEPNASFEAIPASPSRADALIARDLLLNVVVDFPFASDAARAGWVALLLTPFARYAFQGPTPLGVFDGNVAGVGKGKLAQVIGMLVDGCEIPPSPQPEDEAEERKRITSVAISGRRIVLIDNVTRPVGSGALEAVLTATRWSDRVLGLSKDFEGDVLALWLVTGNNVAFRKKDTIRRVVHSRLESPVETPEARTDFTHPDLTAWVRQNRPRLVGAALTMLRAFCAAGRPNDGIPAWGSFEGWSSLVRACVVWCGLADPALTRTELASVADTEGAALRALLCCWATEAADGMTASQALQCAKTNGALREAIAELVTTREGKDVSPKALGKRLHSLRGRIVDEKSLKGSTDRKGVTTWSVKEHPGTAGAGFAGFAGCGPDDRARAPARKVGTVGTTPCKPANPATLITFDDDGNVVEAM